MALDNLGRTVPARPPVLFKLGELLQRQGEFSEADLLFNQLVGTFPDTPEGQLAVGRVHCTHWAVLAGTYPTADEANRVAQPLGEEAVVRPSRHDGQLTFRVQIGSLATYAQGESLLATCRETFPRATLIVSR